MGQGIRYIVGRMCEATRCVDLDYVLLHLQRYVHQEELLVQLVL